MINVPPVLRVSSTSIYGYLHLRDQTLVVVFQSGKAYRYNDVPDYVVENFSMAPSKGKFLGAEIKSIYDFEPLSLEEVELMAKNIGVRNAAVNDGYSRLQIGSEGLAEFFRQYPNLGLMF